MKAIEVRLASAADWPAVSSLLAELGRPDVLGSPEENEHRAGYERYLEREDAVAMVATIDGDVVGFCNLEVRPRLNFLTPEAWIPELIVRSNARSNGAGAALLQRMAGAARERGVRLLLLESGNWRKRAHAFYAREGWTDVAHQFIRRPDGSPIPRLPASE